MKMFGYALNTLFRFSLFPGTFCWKNKLEYLSKAFCKNEIKLLFPHFRQLIKIEILQEKKFLKSLL